MGETPSRFWLLAVIVATVAIFLYMPTWRYDYTYLDDDNLVLNQKSFLEKPSSLYKVFGRSFFGIKSNAYYRPIVNLSFAVNARFNEVRAFGYHFANTLFHALACVLFLALLRRLRFGDPASLLAALFFAVHPVNVSSVAWIPGRNDALLGCFALGACLLLLHDAHRPGKAAKIGHLSCLILALFTKETAICLPVLFIVALWAEEGRHALKRRWWMWAGWAIAFVLYFAARHAVITSPPGYVAHQLQMAFQRWPVLLSDIGKLLLPVRLQVLAAPVDTLAWPGAVVIAIIGAACLIRGMRRGIIALSLALVLLPLLMSLLGVWFAVLETRLYLPVAGVCVLFGEAIRAARSRGSKLLNTAITVTAVLIISTLGVVNLRYVPSFQDRDRFSNAALDGSPNSAIAGNLRFKALHPDMFMDLAPPVEGASR